MWRGEIIMSNPFHGDRVKWSRDFRWFWWTVVRFPSKFNVNSVGWFPTEEAAWEALRPRLAEVRAMPDFPGPRGT